MSPSNPKAAYWQGFRAGSPFILVVAPFALLFGVVATEAGLNIAEVMGMAILVIAGAAQFAALAQMGENAPTYLVLATALAVNLRMALYSASITPHMGGLSLPKRVLVAYLLVDQSYAVSVQKFEETPKMPLNQKLAFYLGVMTPIAPLWYGFSLVGALVGQAIPPEYALDFAVPITFLAITGPMMRTPAHLAAAFVSVVASLLLAFLPYNLWLLIAAALAMMTGAQVELFMERHKP